VLCLSPSGGYAPGRVQCPAVDLFIREGNSISHREHDWRQERQKKTNNALIDFLASANLTSFNPSKFINDNSSDPITLGLAFSGGGYRAMLAGAGQLAALDNRTDMGDDNIGALGGVLQSATYISALSGGGWMLGSLAMQNFPSVQDLVFTDSNDDIWNLTETKQLIDESKSMFTLYWDVLWNNLNGALSHLNYWSSISSDIKAKEKAGFGTTLTDYWGRALAHQLFPSSNNYLDSSTFSDIRNMSSFANHEMPFPLLLAVGRRPGTTVYNLNSTVVEFNPFEIGSFDTSLNSFSDIKYLGTNVKNGIPVQNGSKTCVEGYDNGAFVIGTSSSLFNEYLNTLFCEDCHQYNFIVKWIARKFLTMLSNEYEDVAEISPNPFYESQYSNSGNITKNDTLYLIDGGLGGEVIPLSTLMTTERKMDVVFAFDNSNDLPNNYPDGTSLISTYERQFSSQGKSTLCPYIPNRETFLQDNFTAKPVFFGCDSSNLTDLVKDGVTPPLVVYIANRPFDIASNTSLFQLTYTDQQRKAMINNGFDTVTRLNGTLDESWRTCVACALIRRSEERQGIEQSDQCKKCFQNYCWDGKTAQANGEYYPPQYFTSTGLTNDSDASISLLSPVEIKKRSGAATNKVSMVLLALMTLGAMM
jgi:lysophospholipase